MNFNSAKLVAHIATYVAGFAMILDGGVAYLHVPMPGVTVSDPGAVMIAGAGIIGAAWKADQAATAAKILLITMLGSFLFSPAHAADLPVKAAPSAFSVPSAPCTATSCSGFYGGAFFGGLGDNANIIGNGIAGSFNSGGMMPGADVGYQYFNGSYLFAMEFMGGYQFNSTADVSGASGNMAGPFGILQAKAGASLSALSPSFLSGLNLPLAIITPYLAGGEMFSEHGGTGGVGGGGIEFQLNNSNFLDVEYLNGGGAGTSGNVSASQNNMIFAKFNHLF